MHLVSWILAETNWFGHLMGPLAQADPWILAFSSVTVIATIWLGFWSAKKSRTASDFFVAGRTVSVGWNASAISGEYLSAASFMGIAGMVMSSGYDALWYPVCYACGYLFLLLFIAGPLRRFGAYTIPDFAEGRFDSPVFRKIAVVFVLFIGFFYTMPQMKGAGTTLAYVFPGLPYWVGVALVGAVITLNVALGGMKGITLVQAFQYWAKMFAISVPIFVLMSVYGGYGKQLEANGNTQHPTSNMPLSTNVSNVALNLGSSQRDAEPSNSGTPLDLGWEERTPSPGAFSVGNKLIEVLSAANRMLGKDTYTFGASPVQACSVEGLLSQCAEVSGNRYFLARELLGASVQFGHTNTLTGRQWVAAFEAALKSNGAVLWVDGSGFSTNFCAVIREPDRTVKVMPGSKVEAYRAAGLLSGTELFLRKPLPSKAPSDSAWLNPFGPLTTKAAKAAAAALTNSVAGTISLRPGLTPDTKMTVNMSETNVAKTLAMYAELTGRTLLPRTNSWVERIDGFLGGRLNRWGWVKIAPRPESGVFYHGDGLFSAAEVKEHWEALFRTNGITVVPEGTKYFRSLNSGESGSSAVARQKAWLQTHERPLALLYTYSLIIALVCGTAGLPHILVRFYTNPDGVAAKRTTMWVMILIGVFYLFPPVFGVMGRNLLPELYTGAGAKGTDKVVLELPGILNEHAGKWESEKVGEIMNTASVSPAPSPTFSPAAANTGGHSKKLAWGSILSGITCAGAFAAFMSTFSGLLVSMTGALAHDVYGRMWNPKSTPHQRLRAFKIFAVVVGGIAILLGTQVEQLQINFMVGQAFAIAAASYFPLLFMSTWWRGMTTKGAATGMLSGGVCALAAVTLTNFSDLKWLPLDAFWSGHPLLRILCEQPAIWTVPLAIALMVIVSRLTRNEVPTDVRLKMLVLHAPEQLGLKQEYVQEHQHGH